MSDEPGCNHSGCVEVTTIEEVVPRVIHDRQCPMWITTVCFYDPEIIEGGSYERHERECDFMHPDWPPVGYRLPPASPRDVWKPTPIRDESPDRRLVRLTRWIRACMAMVPAGLIALFISVFTTDPWHPGWLANTVFGISTVAMIVGVIGGTVLADRRDGRQRELDRAGRPAGRGVEFTPPKPVSREGALKGSMHSSHIHHVPPPGVSTHVHQVPPPGVVFPMKNLPTKQAAEDKPRRLEVKFSIRWRGRGSR